MVFCEHLQWSTLGFRRKRDWVRLLFNYNHYRRRWEVPDPSVWAKGRRVRQNKDKNNLHSICIINGKS